MTLVERLRELAKWVGHPEHEKVYREAADHIESLHRECERLKQYEFLYKGYYGDRDDGSIRDQREGKK